MATSLTSHRPGLGVALKLGAIFLFTGMSALIKAASDSVPPGEAVFFRSFFAIPVILAWLTWRGELSQGLRTRNPMLHVKRGLLGTASMGLTFAGLGLLPLPEVTAIGFAAPIFTLILAALILGERIRLVRISAVAVGLVGVLVMLWPRLSGASTLEQGAALGALCVLGATLGRALVQIHIRRMVETEPAPTIVFWFSATASVLGLMTLPFGWVVPDATTAGLLISAGLVGGVAQILVTSSFRFAPASLLAPYDYSSMLFAIIVGYTLFGELPTPVMLAGAALVIAANAVVLWRERRLGLKRDRERDAAALPRN
ncbi:DMT family transporter [Jhaorihella thermophila]|uniref:EamA domain-containing membrane protein RarD n=1 Tax=Jhaorihella thermophila TaxID=488547 RepID=A0A1H5ULZ1_9RHOB|nr:DMT family transporter [Jhaorihella thermophila]SEF76044.1 EamA domain-containing membrane protein RarD [Jhaorihella thermophila]